MTPGRHIPVLMEEAIRYLIIDKDGTYVDGTCGQGGHAKRILEELSDQGRLICIDRDVMMLEAAREHLREHKENTEFYHGSYSDLGAIIGNRLGELSGVLLDLGICSAQLDDENRGFSYRFDSPLDMRFDQSERITAADLVNTAQREELVRIFREYADFRNPGKFAARLVERRDKSPLRTVGDLVSCVEDLVPAKTRFKFTARLLQAIRIAVNGELERLEVALPRLIAFLKPGGRLAVISYHSQEDRRVKRFIRQSSMDSGFPPDMEASMKGTGLTLNSVTRRAVKATADEVRQNPRARSARLRVAERPLSS
jgi:16S rRNA (cytosine1402-N4)-methyltransferase